MASVTLASDVTWSGEGVRSTADIRGKRVEIDEPEKLGGTDMGPNPVELLLSSLGGCLTVVITTFSDQFGVQLRDLRIRVEGDIDPDGFMGKNSSVRPGVLEIRYHVDIDSPSPKERVDELMRHVEKVCPIKDTLNGVPVRVK